MQPKMNEPPSTHDRAVAITSSLMMLVDSYAIAYADHGFAPQEWKALRTALLRALTNERNADGAVSTVGEEAVAQTERSVFASDTIGIHIWTEGGCEPNPGRKNRTQDSCVPPACGVSASLFTPSAGLTCHPATPWPPDDPAT